MIPQLVYSVFTLYMLMVLLRWLGPFLELNFHDIRLRWISTLTDPVVNGVRRILPSLGPMDFGPIVTLLLVYVAREITITIFAGGGS